MASECGDNGESPSYKRIQIWSDGETRQLLDLYANYMSEIGPIKKFKSKKDMWVKIASEVTGKTAKQCEERYKTVLKRKKVAVDNNKTTGSKRKQVEFEDELTKICLMDDSIEPEVQISSHKCLKIEKSGNVQAKVKKKTVQETLLEIADRKEEARERRHKERMDAAAKMQSTLEKILEDKGATH